VLPLNVRWSVWRERHAKSQYYSSVEPILLNRSIESDLLSLCQQNLYLFLVFCKIRRRRKFKLVFFLSTTFKLVFLLDTNLKLVNSQMLLNAAVVHDRVICEPPKPLYSIFIGTAAMLQSSYLLCASLTYASSSHRS
jgi:hypothetical protein